MIKYKIQMGSKFLNEKARQQRDIAFKPSLKGMCCSTCKNDTIIRFVEDKLTHVKAIIESCCPTFEKRIKEKLWSNKS